MATIDSVKLPDNSTYDLTDNYSGYAKKVAGATTDDLASLTATGDLADSGKKLSDLVLKSDVVDNLISTATNKPLSANQGRLIAGNLAANENVYGAKNRNVYPYKDTTKTENGVTFTDNGNGTITVSAASYPYTVSSDTTFYCSNFLDNEFEAGTWTLNGSPVVSDDVFVGYVVHYGGEYLSYLDKGQEVTFTQAVDTDDVAIIITLKSGYVLAGALLFKPMLRDARILDPTFVPYAQTNLQLTNDKAERADLATLDLTGTTNSTGSTINEGVYFYLNGVYCKAKTSIANGATFTLNTNYEEVTVGGDLKKITDTVNYHNSFIPIQQYVQTQSSIMYSLSRGIYIVSVWQGGSVNDFSGLWIAYISNYTGGCSVAPLVTPTIPDIVLSVSANALTITNNNTTYTFDTSVMLINGYM